jgi:acyl-CoA dehydrogenase
VLPSPGAGRSTAGLKRHATAAPDRAAAGATDYLHLMRLVVLGYMWCRIAEAALALDAAAERMRGKLVTGRLFVERMLPETLLHLARIRLGAANLMEWPAEAF